MSTLYYLLAIFDVIISSSAQMLLKKSSSMTYKSHIAEYLNMRVLSAYALMGAAGILNIYAMSKGLLLKEMSIIETLSYLFIPLLSFFIFGERLSKGKILSIVVIVCGILVFFC